MKGSNPMSTIAVRGQIIFEYLAAHLNEPHTRAELLAAVNLNPGSGTDAAIRRARELATAAGLDFPPAVPGTAYTYMITDQAINAVIPVGHMHAIAAGVNQRVAIEFAFIKATADTVEHPVLRRRLVKAAEVQAEKARATVAYDAQLAGLLAEARHIIKYDPAAS
jgi:hypothetical protein